MCITYSIFILLVNIMYSFTLFYINDKLSNQIILLIQEYKLNNLFKSVNITSNQLPIYMKHIRTVPAIIDNNSNTIIEKDKILEFIIRLNLHIKKDELIPYNKEPSLYTDYYSQYNEKDPVNIIFYSSSAFHYINNNLPKIVTYTESPTITTSVFEKQYKELMNERNA